MFLDEAAYLREWIEFHKLVGVERFYLYDHESTDESRALLEPYVERSEVVVRDWPIYPGQVEAYDDCVERNREESRWIAFIDIDEFLFSPTGRPVPEILRDYEEFPAVGVNWVNFGTSGHTAKPQGLVIENFVHYKLNPKAQRTIKSIVDPRRALAGATGHYFAYVDGAVAVDERKRPIAGPEPAFSETPSVELLRINHYTTKSEEEFLRKRGRDRGDTGARYPIKPPRHGDVRDETIQMYLPALRSALSQSSTK
jgi:hypothetical protein